MISVGAGVHAPSHTCTLAGPPLIEKDRERVENLRLHPGSSGDELGGRTGRGKSREDVKASQFQVIVKQTRCCSLYFAACVRPDGEPLEALKSWKVLKIAVGFSPT